MSYLEMAAERGWDAAPTRSFRIRAAFAWAALAVLAAVLACALAAMCFPARALAEEYAGRTDWQVTFTADERMARTPEDMSFADAVREMQPGDTHTVAVATKNEHPRATDWYLTNKVLKSLEESVKVAQDGAYSYRLTYQGPSGEERVLFDSDEVGGDETGESGEGLREATSSLEDFLYLGRLQSGEQGEVTLEVALDGETQNNAYQDTLADIQMNFAVELAEEGAAPPAEPGGDARKSLPQTGDPLGSMWVFALTALVGAGLMLIALFAMRRRKQEEAEPATAGAPAARPSASPSSDARPKHGRAESVRVKGGSHGE